MRSYFHIKTLFSMFSNAFSHKKVGFSYFLLERKYLKENSNTGHVQTFVDFKAMYSIVQYM